MNVLITKYLGLDSVTLDSFVFNRKMILILCDKN